MTTIKMQELLLATIKQLKTIIAIKKLNGTSIKVIAIPMKPENIATFLKLLKQTLINLKMSYTSQDKHQLQVSLIHIVVTDIDDYHRIQDIMDSDAIIL